MKKTLALLLLAIPVATLAQSGSFRGIVTDSQGEAVPYVTVVIQNPDSVMTEAVLTDAEGYFDLQHGFGDNHIIIVQHLSYNTAVLSGADLRRSRQITIHEKENTIDDIIVRGERPAVTIIDNKLSYDAQALTKDRIVNTAFDMVKEIPGITGTDDELQLVGASKFTIVINGQITSMSLSDLYTLLRSIPAGQVKRMNVAYNAPAKYNFNGAVIEVELMDNTGYEGVTGEVAADYVNNFYSGGKLRGSVNVEKERFSLNILGELGRRKSFGRDSTYSRHRYFGDDVDIYQTTARTGKPNNYSVRIGSDYKLHDGGNINFSYYYSGTNNNAVNTADNLFDGPGIERDVLSRSRLKSNTHLHNLHLQYDGLLSVGGDYTRYNSPDRGHYTDYENGITDTDYTMRFSQMVDKGNFFLNHSTAVDTWKMDYGLNFTAADSRNNSDYFYTLPAAVVTGTVSRQREYFANAFFEVSKQVNEKLSLKLGIKGEYQYSNIENDGVKKNLWSEWAFYPDASLTYMPADKHILQFNITSDKNYPPYWALSTNESQMNAYSYVIGNPNLKPSSEYHGQLTYIFNRKYILTAFMSYNADLFRQLPYQLENDLHMQYQFVNMDFQLQYGLSLVVPFRIGDVLSSRFMINGVEMVDRIKDFHGMNVRNSVFWVYTMLRNTIALYHGKTKLDLQVDGYYHTKAVQGVFDLGTGIGLSAGLKWTVNEKLSASAKWDNILRRQQPRPVKVDWADQYSVMRFREYGVVTLNLTWRFGKYEEKKFRNVDSSRFGRN
ncbi:MAG: TonB-dependent receptor [Alistipes sp.]|nr:TonB-dependent receptor [Alistipes sp.]